MSSFEISVGDAYFGETVQSTGTELMQLTWNTVPSVRGMVVSLVHLVHELLTEDKK
jgi:hypothetical protein